MSANEQNKWNKIYAEKGHKQTSASEVLKNNLHLLPSKGVALDVACGRGGNARLLAQQGLETHAWDISGTVLDQLKTTANNLGLNIDCQQRDIPLEPPIPNSFDVITVSHYLDRNLIPYLIQALNNRGLIYYQTFIKDKADDIGPTNDMYLLESNELLMMFQSLKLVLYREEATIGDTSLGFRNEAMLIAQKW